MTTPPCTIAAKHKWQWAENFVHIVTTTDRFGSTRRASLRGLYTCTCGTNRTGKANQSGPDLRELLP